MAQHHSYIYGIKIMIMIKLIRKELVFKLDFINWEFEIGNIWVIIFILWKNL